jgi:hypothetical protein
MAASVMGVEAVTRQRSTIGKRLGSGDAGGELSENA